jgi:hypothetical protein
VWWQERAAKVARRPAPETERRPLVLRSRRLALMLALPALPVLVPPALVPAALVPAALVPSALEPSALEPSALERRGRPEP